MNLYAFTDGVPALPEISAESVNGQRWYTTPDGARYPSVTTVLGGTADKVHLDAWRERIGDEEADRISQASRDDGTAMHAALEAFVLGQQPEFPRERVRQLFRSLLQLLPRIDKICHIEAGLYSDRLKLAGRTDLIAEYDGVLAVIDYKNSLKSKRPEWAKDYLIQGTAYAEMYRDMTGVEINQVVALIGIAGKTPQAFACCPRTYRADLLARIRKFWQMEEAKAA